MRATREQELPDNDARSARGAANRLNSATPRTFENADDRVRERDSGCLREPQAACDHPVHEHREPRARKERRGACATSTACGSKAPRPPSLVSYASIKTMTSIVAIRVPAAQHGACARVAAVSRTRASRARKRNQRCKREHGCDRKQSHRHGSLLVHVAHRSAAEEPSVGQGPRPARRKRQPRQAP